MVKNVPFIADDMSLISGQVTKNPHAEEILRIEPNLREGLLPGTFSVI